MKKELKTFYKNRLPHITPLGAEFFITFRSSDSIPASVILSLKEEMDLSIERIKRKSPKDLKFKINRIKYEFSFKYDKYLHNLHGKCYLRKEEIAQIVARRIQKYDGKLYTLEAYCIMPNHVHMLIDTSIQLDNKEDDSTYVQLNKIMQLIKGGSAR